MIKSEVLSKDKNEMNISVAIRGKKEEIYTEIKGILKSFNEDPDLTPLLLKAMDELIKENTEDK